MQQSTKCALVSLLSVVIGIFIGDLISASRPHPAAGPSVLTTPPLPPLVENISLSTSTLGEKLTDVDMTNQGEKPLNEVNVVLTFKTEDARDVVVKRYWMSWETGETKSISLPENIMVEKIAITGTCSQGRLDSTWEGKSVKEAIGFNPVMKRSPEEQGQRHAQLISEGYFKETKQILISRQTDKVKQLHVALASQYTALEAKRLTVKEKEQIAEFNKEVAEYGKQMHGLRAEEDYLKGLSANNAQ